METILPAIIIGIVVSFVLYLVGSSRNAGEAMASKPDDLTSFTTQTPKGEVVKTVLLFAQMSGLNVESIDDAQGKIVLGEDMNLAKNHNGYWLPVYISENGSGTTTVQIGIKSKVYQAGFMLRSIRDKAANNIKAAIVMQGNRTA
jgi:hypothetical protein